ncbi:type II secretion system protein J [Chryseomicrobium aureum]|uniref:type II secretion system protein J n=1 Tax=Chryseomicrobium aureum TaxID=1441723 RepID=UPI00370DBAEE
MYRNFLNSKGFTLVEVLASVVLLAVVLSIALSVFPNMFRTNEVNEESLDSVAVAKDALVRAKGWEIDGANPPPQFNLVSSNETFNKLFPDNNKPTQDFYVATETTPLSGGYQIYYLVDDNEVDGLDLFEVTIYVVEKESIRATNYGYLTSDNLPVTVTGG